MPTLSSKTPSKGEKLDCKKVPQDTENAILGSLSVFHQGILTFINQKLTPDKIILTGGNSHYFKGIHNKVVLIDEFFTSKALNYILNEYVK